MKTYAISLFIIAAMMFNGCKSEQDKNNQSKSAHENVDGDVHDNVAVEKDEHSDEIVFTKEQAKLVGLTTETISPGAFQNVIKTSGQIQTSLGDEVTIVATSNGIVSLVDPSITEGYSVREGEAIVTISAKKLLEGDPAIKAKAEYEAALKQFQRSEELVKDNIISEKEYEQSRLRYLTAKNTYEAQASNMTESGIRVTSPIGGYIRNSMVGQGEYVTVGQPIATVSQNKRLQLRAEVSENNYKYLKTISSANFKPGYDNRVYKLADLNGRLLSLGKASGEKSFFIPVTFEFENPGDIIPGSFTEVFLLTSPQNNVISVPVTSITEEQGLHFVYLQVHDDEYKKQEVTLGQNNGIRVQILSGLNVGDKVVTKGVYQVKLAATSSVVPEGHSH